MFNHCSDFSNVLSGFASAAGRRVPREPSQSAPRSPHLRPFLTATGQGRAEAARAREQRVEDSRSGRGRRRLQIVELVNFPRWYILLDVWSSDCHALALRLCEGRGWRIRRERTWSVTGIILYLKNWQRWCGWRYATWRCVAVDPLQEEKNYYISELIRLIHSLWQLNFCSVFGICLTLQSVKKCS